MPKTFIKTLESFMEAWKKGEWGAAARATQLTWKNAKVQDDFLKLSLSNKKTEGAANPAEALKDLLIPSIPKFLEYEIKGHKSISNVTKDVKIAIGYESDNNTILHKTLIARVICEKAPFQPAVNGKWGVNPVSLFTKR